jgi:SAM-dependent methyltransferase
MTLVLRVGDRAAELDVDRWRAPATDAEREFLRRLRGPVIDLGCGPGRLVIALAEFGIPALGIDASPIAIRHATARGACVLRRSVFDPLPREGGWRAALLLDGNVGIGGDPIALLRRAARLVAPDGYVVVEVEPPGRPTIIGSARLEDNQGSTARFPWACVGADDLAHHASAAGLAIDKRHTIDGRFIAMLRRTWPVE